MSELSEVHVYILEYNHMQVMRYVRVFNVMNTNITSRLTHHGQKTAVFLEGAHTSDQAQDEEDDTNGNQDGCWDKRIIGGHKLFVVPVLLKYPCSDEYKTSSGRLSRGNKSDI